MKEGNRHYVAAPRRQHGRAERANAYHGLIFIAFCPSSSSRATVSRTSVTASSREQRANRTPSRPLCACRHSRSAGPCAATAISDGPGSRTLCEPRGVAALSKRRARAARAPECHPLARRGGAGRGGAGRVHAPRRRTSVMPPSTLRRSSNTAPPPSSKSNQAKIAKKPCAVGELTCACACAGEPTNVFCPNSAYCGIVWPATILSTAIITVSNGLGDQARCEPRGALQTWLLPCSGTMPWWEGHTAAAHGRRSRGRLRPGRPSRSPSRLREP